jgi:hypothetical protein
MEMLAVVLALFFVLSQLLLLIEQYLHHSACKECIFRSRQREAFVFL